MHPWSLLLLLCQLAQVGASVGPQLTTSASVTTYLLRPGLLIITTSLEGCLTTDIQVRKRQAMAGSSLFSRAHRPGVYTPKKLRGFLALPGEVRNQIYNYYFESERHCEIIAKGKQFQQQKKPLTVKLSSGIVTPSPLHPAPNTIDTVHVVRFSRCLGKYNMIQGLQTNWLRSPYALVLVCKQVYAETATYLYRKTVFIFDAPKRMANFFNVVPNTRLECITKLNLHYNTYGHPRSTDHIIWQDKHGQSW